MLLVHGGGVSGARAITAGAQVHRSIPSMIGLVMRILVGMMLVMLTMVLVGSLVGSDGALGIKMMMMMMMMMRMAAGKSNILWWTLPVHLQSMTVVLLTINFKKLIIGQF